MSMAPLKAHNLTVCLGLKLIEAPVCMVKVRLKAYKSSCQLSKITFVWFYQLTMSYGAGDIVVHKIGHWRPEVNVICNEYINA